jgi:hypothetical protein
MMAEVSKLVRDAYGIGDGSTITEEAEGQEVFVAIPSTTFADKVFFHSHI